MSTTAKTLPSLEAHAATSRARLGFTRGREAVDLRPRERPGRGRHRDAQSHGKRRCQARLLPPGLAELHRDGTRAAGGLAHHVPVPCDFQHLDVVRFRRLSTGSDCAIRAACPQLPSWCMDSLEGTKTNRHIERLLILSDATQ